jgi:hypothetical protein
MQEHTTLERALVWAIAALVAVFVSASGPTAAGISASDSPCQVLLIAPEGEYERLSDALSSLNVRILHEFPPDAVIAEAQADLANRAVSEGWARFATAGEVPAAVRDSLSPGAQLAAAAWTALHSPESPGYLGEEPVLVVGDALRPPDTVGLEPQALDPALYQQSEYLIGKVAVNLVLVESDGSVDPSSENWTPDRQQQVFQQVVQALSWWQAREPRAQLQFVYENHYSNPVRVPYEPITRPHYEDRLWISHAMQSLGFGHSSYITAVRLFNRATRERHNADWVFTIFVVDSLNDSDNLFSDGYFAYAYIHGPYMVMTYGNNGYGPERMGAVAAHEIGHIFGALDEYAGANIPASTVSGYLGVPNGNSQIGGSIDVGCIMRGGIAPYHQQQLCPFTAGQVGWRDSDGDGLLDPVDTGVQVELNLATQDESVRLLGTASELPYPSPNRQPLSINRVAGVEYRVNGGPWRSVSASDGRYDSQVELFDQALPPAPVGEWSTEVRARNTRSGQGLAEARLSVPEGEDPLPKIAVQASVDASARPGQAVLFGTVTAPPGAGALVALEARLDNGAWLSVPAADGALDSPEERFSVTFQGLSPGEHQIQVRAAAENPWVGCGDWEQVLAVAGSPKSTPPTVTGPAEVYVPLVTTR